MENAATMPQAANAEVCAGKKAATENAAKVQEQKGALKVEDFEGILDD